jgi:hypothetical protein
MYCLSYGTSERSFYMGHLTTIPHPFRGPVRDGYRGGLIVFSPRSDWQKFFRLSLMAWIGFASLIVVLAASVE